jgi:hypothetical protein
VTTAAFILAEGIGDVLFIVVVVVLALLGKLFQKSAEQRQEQKDEQRAAEDRETVAQRHPEVAVEPPARPARRLAPAPAAPQAAAPPTSATPKTREQRLEDRHLQKLETAEIGRAMASRRLKGGRASAKRRSGKPDDTDGPATQDAVRPVRKVNLSSRSQARRAMLYHEIFSAPKALRSGKEMWDR